MRSLLVRYMKSRKLAQDPDSAIQLMKEKAGVKIDGRSGQRLPDRKAEILGWEVTFGGF